MNIYEAKMQIKNAVIAYLQKDADGSYKIPSKRQRPVFLVGAPGIGKTAVMEQIAGELGVGLVSYSMIHHTRQSALGLPYIVKKQYGGKEVAVSEYTMSEIIASVYDTMAATEVKEGILFLDEVNCVSETLAPAMLQFLQFKTFGRHALPQGWIVVTAGNPPEYNKSVRSFDVVTLDRIKKIEVEPDFGVWREYAFAQKVHPAVMAYLSVKQEDFCRVETTVEGKAFVTPRGWDDLSEMMKEYEECGFTVDEALICQYLQNPRIAKDFAAYYALYRKYKSSYQVADILAGREAPELKERARHAGFDERISLIELLIAAVNRDISAVNERERGLKQRHTLLQAVKTGYAQDSTVQAALTTEIKALSKKLDSAALASSLTETDKRVLFELRKTLQAEAASDDFTAAAGDDTRQFALLKESFDKEVAALGEGAEGVKTALNHLFAFVAEVFGEDKEMLLLVTELTVNKEAVRFIARYGCEAYFEHHHDLLFDERRREIDDILDTMDL